MATVARKWGGDYTRMSTTEDLRGMFFSLGP